MKIEFKNLFFLATFAVATLTTSCDNNDENVTTGETQPYVVYENHIMLTGEDNMRDLGGYLGENNKRVLYHKLFRSGELSALTTSDLDTIKKLNINQIIDLRTQTERSSKPDKTVADVSEYSLPLIADVSGGMSESALMGQILSGQIKATDYMIKLYNPITTLEEDNWKNIFNLLETGHTTLWHCTAGKDRAGMTTVLVLSSLGVDKETIIQDFLDSNTYLSPYIEKTVSQLNAGYGNGVGELIRPMLGVDKTYILAFYDAIDKQYGSMDNFLNKLGVDKVKMKNNYLEK